MTTLCPCGSTMSYADCCEPFHLSNARPATAAQLMRSRYAAFELQLTDYIVATTVPFEQALLDKQAISDWAAQTRWDGLEVINHLPKLGKRHAQVEFKAYFIHEGQRLAHHELSAFVRIGKDSTSRWYFLDPTIPLSISQKQPCPCGSGEKYKRCCGQFLI